MSDLPTNTDLPDAKIRVSVPALSIVAPCFTNSWASRSKMAKKAWRNIVA